jgi:hypothetical protein
LQLQHLANFQNCCCPNCDYKFCFRCGQKSHGTRSCQEEMKLLLDAFSILPAPSTSVPTSSRRSFVRKMEELNNLKWKLENSKPCPKCFVLIHRDEGCNKVDCSFCGFRFCWVCCSSWSNSCSFYKCKTASTSAPTCLPTPTEVSPTNSIVSRRNGAEIGVPDIVTIQRRLISPPP